MSECKHENNVYEEMDNWYRCLDCGAFLTATGNVIEFPKQTEETPESINPMAMAYKFTEHYFAGGE